MNSLPLAIPVAHVLVVDDDARLRRLLERYLHEQGYAVTTAENTAKAMQILSLLKPDVMVLDVMMPGQTGLEFARELASGSVSSPVPIVMLTALDTANDRIAGLESGVEDYLSKPFEPRELLLRLSNILKRRKPVESTQSYITFGEYRFYTASQQLEQQEKGYLTLTTAERELLAVLAGQPNTPVSRELLALRLGGGASKEMGDNLRHVDVQIGRLRRKLGKGDWIQTVRGKGYKLVVTS